VGENYYIGFPRNPERVDPGESPYNEVGRIGDCVAQARRTEMFVVERRTSPS
jgi:hypothetical protein